MAEDDSGETRVVSRKQHAKEMRKQAYQRAKEQRAKDPKVIAMKEEMKARRREQYQQLKQARQAAKAQQKATSSRALRHASQDTEDPDTEDPAQAVRPEPQTQQGDREGMGQPGINARGSAALN